MVLKQRAGVFFSARHFDPGTQAKMRSGMPRQLKQLTSSRIHINQNLVIDVENDSETSSGKFYLRKKR